MQSEIENDAIFIFWRKTMQSGMKNASNSTKCD